MSTPKASTPAPALKISLPIELLPTDLARIFSQAHPALLLSAYYIRFPSLVADPVPTLLHSLLPLAALQLAYVVLCLPAAGSNTKAVKKVKFGPAKKSLESAKGTRVFTSIYALLFSILSAVPITALLILFGAPLTTHLPHTALLSLHIALLAVFPLIYAHGLDGKKWREIGSFYSPIDEVFGGFVGAMVGTWVGAVPIPLDWDREWQKWPVTILCGAYGGCAVGKVVGGWWLKGKKIELD